MLNEGIVGSDDRAAVKTIVMQQLGGLGPATPQDLEGAVFKQMTGHGRDEVDWDVDDNKAGYFTWIKAFDGLLAELEDDGFLKTETVNGRPLLTLRENEPAIGWSRTFQPKS